MAADKTKSDARAKRLEEQLRANLARRKAQARAKREGASDTRGDGIATTLPKPDGK